MLRVLIKGMKGIAGVSQTCFILGTLGRAADPSDGVRPFYWRSFLWILTLRLLEVAVCVENGNTSNFYYTYHILQSPCKGRGLS